ELGRDDVEQAPARLERLALRDLARRLDQIRPRRSAEAAADDDALDVEEVRERADACAEVAADVVQDLERSRVAFTREAHEPVRVGGRAERLLREQGRGVARAVRLEMAAPRARALAGPAVVLDDHVPALSRCTGTAAVGTSVED